MHAPASSRVQLDERTMANDFAEAGSANSSFTCGHANPVSNRYCDECGAPRDPRCRLCHAPNRADAKFCGACGTRLIEGPWPDAEASASAEGRRWRRDDEPDPAFDESLAAGGDHLEDRWRRPLLLTTAVVVAIVGTIALVIALGPTRHPTAPVAPHVEPSPPDRPPAPRPDEKSEAPRPTPTPNAAIEPVPAPSAAVEPAPAAPESPSASEPAPSASASLPDRAPSGAPSEEAESDRRASGPPAASARTSEERMAAFLTQQLGPAEAAAKALSTAAWYDTSRPEYAYWKHVAEAIEQRGSR